MLFLCKLVSYKQPLSQLLNINFILVSSPHPNRRSVRDALYIACEYSIFSLLLVVKVARYSFSKSIPPKFERKLRRHKQRFGKIDTTVVLDKYETLLWSGLQWHRSCHGNEMTPLPTLLAAVYLGTGNCSSKIVY